MGRHRDNALLCTQIRHILGFQLVDRHTVSLGAPAEIGRSKKALFDYVRERVSTKVHGWGEKQLSMAGREVLIKSVLQSIPTYVMSMFLLADIEKIIRRFWWNGAADCKIAWKAWGSLCSPMRAGGLGFRDLKVFNLTLLAKQGWRILSQPNSLVSCLLKVQYFPHCDFLAAKAGHRPSAMWRGICKAKCYLARGLRWKIGDGSSISLWHDAWLPDGNGRIITVPNESVSSLRICDLIILGTHTWNSGKIAEIFWPVDAERIQSIPLDSGLSLDTLIWIGSKFGTYSVKSGYHFFRNLCLPETEWAGSSRTNDADWSFIWKMEVPNKIRNFIWKVAWNILPTAAELQHRKVVLYAQCSRCGFEREDWSHALISCPSAKETWLLAGFNIQVVSTSVSNPFQWLQGLRKALVTEEFAFFGIVCWSIWFGRNKGLYHDHLLSPMDTVNFANNYYAEFRSIRR